MRLLEAYRELHRQGAFEGDSLLPHLAAIGELIKRYEITSILDYGSGKGKWQGRLGLPVVSYDPGIEGKDILPPGPFDLVICTDVLEHVPEDELDQVLKDIFSRAVKFAYFCVNVECAAAVLPNGENAHVTVKPWKWWKRLIRQYCTVPTKVVYAGKGGQILVR